MHVVTAHAEKEAGFGAIADTVQPLPSLPHAGASNCHRLIAAPTPAAARIAEALTLLCRWRDKTDALRLWHGSLVWRGFGGTPEMARSARMSECGADRSIVLAQRSSRGCLPQQDVPSICTLPEARVQPGTAERGTAFDSASRQPNPTISPFGRFAVYIFIFLIKSFRLELDSARRPARPSEVVSPKFRKRQDTPLPPLVRSRAVSCM